MSSQPKSRDELYERIRKSSKDEVILEEMVRLGFWEKGVPLPQGPPDEIARREELERELRTLRTENVRMQNEEAFKKEYRKRRMEESKIRQKENKERRIREREERAEAWEKQKETEIIFIGSEKSGGLNNLETDSAKLKQLGLPVYETAAQLAEAFELTVGTLRFLAFSRDVSTTSHYVRFTIPKKSGGQRLISAPMPKLKTVQYRVLSEILEKISLHDAAHGFCPTRSIVSNARPHLGNDIVINMDLKDFFPTITYKRVKGVFSSFGYSEAIATILALLCTEPEIEEVEMDGKRYFVSLGRRHLPQGAPTSPTISNIISRRLDKNLARLAEKHNACYTRYADDLTFSIKNASDPGCNPGSLLRQADYIVSREGFVVHPEKTRILRKSRRQEVTGITVNEKLNVSRKQLKNFRALLFQIEKDGPQGKKWGASDNIFESIKGFANFVAMVNPEKGAELTSRVKKILEKFGSQ
ncbi:MAG: RNA-directed DNA polymerase [bacterium]|nr:RNA-directed DNA polymerase [bacterium]